jgi:hypothetical protein
MKKLLLAWFSLKQPVTRAQYLAGGALFMLLKFTIERAIFAAWIGGDLTLGGFLRPFFVDRLRLLQGAPDGVTWTMIGLALPFVWIGISMSVRRAVDAGLPPLLGFLFLIPGLQWALILGLCLAPTAKPAEVHPLGGAYRPAPPQEAVPAQESPSDALRATRAVAAASGVGFAMFGICVYGLHSYGNALFLATPFVMGVVAVVAYRRIHATSPGGSPEAEGDGARSARQTGRSTWTSTRRSRTARCGSSG